MHAEQLGELATALCKAQAEIAHPLKSNKVNAGPMKYTYADLPSVIDAIRTVFNKHGLSFTQMTGATLDKDVKSVSVTTVLMHTSGQSLSSKLDFPVLDIKPHTIGSALTYARRYALSAMAGIAAEVDDDANIAQGTKSPSFSRTNKK
jgi:hypothetical protein